MNLIARSGVGIEPSAPPPHIEGGALMRTWKRMISLVLALILAVTLMPPTPAYARNGETDDSLPNTAPGAEAEKEGSITPAAEPREEDAPSEAEGSISPVTEADLEAAADSGSCGENMTWTLQGTVLRLSGSGVMRDYNAGGVTIPWQKYREEITDVVIEDGITQITSNAFQNFTRLTGIDFGTTLSKIDSNIFYGCTALRAVTLPENIVSIGSHVFYGCTALTDVTILGGVTHMGAHVFEDCSSLQRVYLGARLTVLGDYTFARCSSLETITLPEGLRKMGDFTFSECFSLKEIFFQGEAPGFEDNTFNRVTATAYYPRKYFSWEYDYRLQDYGGTITWLPFEKYGMLIDGTPVTDENAADVLGNGVFSYDSASNTLTIHKSYTARTDRWLIHNNCLSGLTINVPTDVTLTGRNEILHLTDDTVLKGEGSLTAVTCGESAITVENASRFMLEDFRLSIPFCGGLRYGIFSEGITSAFEVFYSRVEIHAEESAILWPYYDAYEAGVILKDVDVILPEDKGELGYNYNPYDDEPDVLFVPQRFDLRIDGTWASRTNAADILENGAFSYDEESNTLTVHQNYTATRAAVVESGLPGLTVSSERPVTLTRADGDPEGAVIEGEGDLRLTGDMTLLGDAEAALGSGVSVQGEGARLTLDCAQIAVEHTACGLQAEPDAGQSLLFRDSTCAIRAEQAAISGFTGGFTREGYSAEGFTLTEPANYSLDEEGCVCTAEGQRAGDFILDCALWVSGIKVSGANWMDILGGGEASYDAAAAILTISSLRGAYNDSLYRDALIYAELPEFTIEAPEGSSLDVNTMYMDAEDGTVGIYAAGKLTMQGNISFTDLGRYCVYTESDLTIHGELNAYGENDCVLYCRNGDVTITGNAVCANYREEGVGCCVYAENGDILLEGDFEIVNPYSGGYGLYAPKGEISIRNGQTKISCGGDAIAARDIHIPLTHAVTNPVGGRITQAGDFVTVTEADGVTVAKDVVITPPVGDLNGDHRVDALDLLILRKYLVGLLPIHTLYDPAMDMNIDYRVDIRDLVCLRKLLARAEA